MNISAPFVCRQNTSEVTFSHAVNTHWLLLITLPQECVDARFMSTAWSSMSCVWVLSVLWLSVPHLVVPFSVFLLFHSSSTLTLSWTLSSIWSPPGRHSTKWGIWSLGRNHSFSQVMNIPDDFRFSEILEIFLQELPSDNRTLSSPLFMQEPEEPADGRQACWKFVASSVLVSVSCKNGETRAWNSFANQEADKTFFFWQEWWKISKPTLN